MTLKDDFPTAKVARRRATRRKSSKRYYNETTKRTKSGIRRSTRTATSAAKTNIKSQASADNAQDFGLEAAFDIACQYSTNRRKQREVLDGAFTIWKVVTDAPKSHIGGSYVLGNTVPLGESVTYAMYINRNFRHPTRKPKMVPWLTVRPSSLEGSPGAPVGFGVFADKQFEKGDTVGVYMGKRVKVTHAMDLETHPYCLSLHGKQYGVDAQGGVGSGFPIGMAMHIMNDPHFTMIDSETNPNKKMSANVEFQTHGRCVATRRILKGAEMLVHYSAGGISEADS